MYPKLQSPGWRHWIGRCISLLAAVMLIALSVPPAESARMDDNEEGDTEYVRIEEDWLLKVNDPDPFRGAPQVATQMAPGQFSRYFCVFQINFRELGQFHEGGLQVQLWRDGKVCNWMSAGSAVMGSRDETVAWTQAMSRDGFKLNFSIKAGISTTWGNLAEHNLATETWNLRRYFTAYDSADSVKKSGISFGANRVKQLILVEVRKYKEDGTCDKETTPRTVFDESQLGQ